MEQDPHALPQRKAGGWRSIKYILGNESFEKLASMSLVANMLVYLRTRYNLGGIFLVNVVSIWSGTSNIAPLVGAFISDVWLGKFLTLFFGSVASLLGMATVTLTAAIPHLRPPTCHGQHHCIQPHKWQLGFLFIGLSLLAIGAGGIRPCNIAFGADQFDTTTEKGKLQLQTFFNWWYFSFTIALLISLTGVVYVQTNVSWVLGFAIPTACLAFSITLFLMGCHTYIYKKPQGSVFSDMAKVVTAAFRKRKIALQNHHSFYYSGEESIQRTDRFKCLDKAAIIIDIATELDAQGIPKNSWGLCSVQQVEQLKSLVGIVPVWFSGLGCFIVMDQQSTFGVLQAMQMERSIGRHFMIPPAWMGVTSMIALSIWIFFYQRIYIPNAKKILKNAPRLTMQQRMKTGIVMSILCMLVAGVVEKRRRDSALKHGSFVSPLSVALLLPQFVLSGLTEAFENVAVMEFFTTQMPENMRSVAGSVFFLTLAIASYLSTLISNVIHSISGRNGREPWLGGHDLNHNRLEYYYYIIAAVAVINLVYFTFFASNYLLCGEFVAPDRELQLESSISLDSRNLSKAETRDEENVA